MGSEERKAPGFLDGADSEMELGGSDWVDGED